jgi:hypothetical protein
LEQLLEQQSPFALQLLPLLTQVETQVPFVQVWPVAQAWPHAPQLLVLVLRLTHVPPQLVCPDGQAHLRGVVDGQKLLQQSVFDLQALPRPRHGGGLALASWAPPRMDNAPASPNPKALRAWRRVVVVASALASSSNRFGSFGSIIVSPAIVFVRGIQ